MLFTTYKNIYYLVWQALMDVIAELKLNPLAIFYYEEEEVLLWKDFLEQETKTKVIAPIFQRLPSPKNEAATR